VYLVVLYKKIQRAGLTFILTIIAVAVSAMKRRGGMGTKFSNRLHWLCLCFFLKSLEYWQRNQYSAYVSRLVANIAFGILALYLLRNAKR
jgi:lipopolysaccharide export system permease protein